VRNWKEEKQREREKNESEIDGADIGSICKMFFGPQRFSIHTDEESDMEHDDEEHNDEESDMEHNDEESDKEHNDETNDMEHNDEENDTQSSTWNVAMNELWTMPV